MGGFFTTLAWFPIFLHIFLTSFDSQVPATFILFIFFILFYIIVDRIVWAATMRSTTLHTAAIAALFCSTLSLAQQARSVSTAEFKAMFRESGIVPEILPATLDPQVSFYASYSRADGQQAQIIPGTKMSASGEFND